MENDVPQRSALSVTLFLVVLREIAEQISEPVKFYVFVDDGKLN